MKPGRACASGPPWIEISTGRLPVNFAGGLTMNPPIGRPSKLFHSMRSALRNCVASSPATLLSVQRVTLLSRTSMAYASPGLCALAIVTARSREFSCQTSRRTPPTGSGGRGSARRVAASYRRSTPTPPSLVMTASSGRRATARSPRRPSCRRRRSSRPCRSRGRDRRACGIRRRGRSPGTGPLPSRAKLRSDEKIGCAGVSAFGRQHAALRAGREVHHPDVGFVDRLELEHREALVVEREREVAPAGPGQRGDLARLRGIERVDEREIERRVLALARLVDVGRFEQHVVARARDAAGLVLAVGVGEQHRRRAARRRGDRAAAARCRRCRARRPACPAPSASTRRCAPAPRSR